jgi:hypothetical protein
MPVSYNSPARNFFLLASTGQQEITAFIKRITTPSSSDTFGYEPARIEYVESDQKYLVSGTQYDAQDDQLPEGYLVKTTENDTRDFDLKIQSTVSAVDRGTTIRSIARDSNENIIICGRLNIRLFQNGGSPYVGKFDLNGNNLWYASTTESSVNWDIEYTDIAIDANDNIFVVGYDSKNGDDGTIISRYTPDGAVIWSKKLQDIGSDGFVDIRGSSISVNNRNELVVAGSLEGITREKGFVAKYDLNGNQIWLKTFEDKELATNSSYRQVVFNSAHVDDNGYIYCAGYSEDPITLEYKGVVLRLNPEGNLVWQNKTNYSNSITYTSVSADTLTGQTIVAGDVWTGSEGFTIIQRFGASGKLSWTRKLSSTNARSAFVNITSDPSYYYITYADETQQASDPESFLYGKLSITGNGLGTFAYSDGVLNQDYVVTTIPIKTGTLFDGSIRNDKSDFVTYPHSATKILFDDLTMIYQPKQPVHDGSDHDIVNDNMLTAEDITVLANNTSIIDTSSFVYIHGTTGGTGAGQVGGFDLGGTYHLRFGSFNPTEHQLAGYAGTEESLSISRKFDTFPIDLRQVASVSFETIRGTDTNGGEDPDTINENLRLYYSIDGGNTFTLAGDIRTFNSTQVGNTLYINTVFLPNAAKTNSTILRVQQDDHNGTSWDHWGITQFTLVGDVVSTPEAPKLSTDGIVYGSNLLLNYDFGNRSTYDRAENLIPESEDLSDSIWSSFPSTNAYSDEKVLDPFGLKTAIVPNFTSAKWGLFDHSNGAWFSGYEDGQLYPFIVTDTWQRQSITFTVPSGSTAVRFYPMRRADSGAYTYYVITGLETGATYTASAYYKLYTDGVKVISWGCQVNKGSLGRYIKTSGTAITAPITVKNLSSSAYTGTINEPTFSPNGYFEHEGTAQTAGSIYAPNSGLPTGSSARTMEAWVYMDTLGAGSNPGFLTYGNDAAGEQSGLRYVGTGLQVSFWTGTYDFNTGYDPGFTHFFHYVATYDNNDLVKAYVNGSIIGQKDLSATPLNTVLGGNLMLFRVNEPPSGPNYYPHDGRIGEVRIYNRALSDAEIYTNYLATRNKYSAPDLFVSGLTTTLVSQHLGGYSDFNTETSLVDSSLSGTDISIDTNAGYSLTTFNGLEVVQVNETTAQLGSFSNLSSLPTGTSWSCAMWVYYNAANFDNEGHRTFFSSDKMRLQWDNVGTGNTEGLWKGELNIGGTVSAFEIDNTNGYDETLTIANFLNRWNHVMYTSDGTNVKLYWDGTLQATLAVSSAFRSSSTADFGIGYNISSLGGGDSIERETGVGYIGGFNIWSSALSSGEAGIVFESERRRYGV